jgi:hypothetical protein
MAVDAPTGSISKGTILALLIGGALAGATLEAGPISWISANRIIAIPQTALVYLLVPGLVISAGVGSLLPGAAINGLIYFGLTKFIYWLATRSRHSANDRSFLRK